MAGSKRAKLKKPFSSIPLPEDDDQELVNDLLAELDSRNQTVQAESANVLNDIQLNKQADQTNSDLKKNPKSRFKARQARRAAELAQHHCPVDANADAQLEREAKDEEKAIQRTCDKLNVEIHEINPDGHCLFSAVADQLACLSILPPTQANYITIRQAASTYIYTHPDDFLPFLPSGEDGVGAIDTGPMDHKDFEAYCVAIRNTGVWGGEPEILALSRAYNVPIHVVQGGSPPIVIHNPIGGPDDGDLHENRVVRVSYHRRMYGLGEHYNSLRPKRALSTQISDSIHNMLN